MNDLVSTEQTMSFNDMARDKIRKTLMDLIPDSQIDAMIKKEFDAYFSPTIEKSSWGNSTTEKPSEFSRLVNDELKSLLKKTVTERIQELYNSHVSNNLGEIDKNIAKLMARCNSAVMSSVFNDMVNTTIMNVANANGGWCHNSAHDPNNNNF